MVGGVDRDVASDRGLLSLALDAAGDRDRSVRDVHGERADVSAPSRRDRTDDLQQSGGRRAASVRGPADEELEHGQADTLRAGVARAIQTLVSASETSLKASEATSQQLQTLSETVRKRLDSIERKQREIERFQTQLLHSLSSHTEQTKSLVQQVNAFLDE